MKIGVIGVGRLGICFALLLDQAGHHVMATDIRTNYVAQLQQRRIMTNEPGVAALLSSCNIEFGTDTRHLLQNCDIIYVMVATPSRADGGYDITAVDRVVCDIEESDFDIHGKILVIGCTTNPGDCRSIQQRLSNHGVQVLYNPEFIAQGSIIRDLQQADMVLIGGDDVAVIQRYQQLYHDIQVGEPRIHSMSLTAAEIVKIGINCFLTTKISYANMMGEVLTRSGLDADVSPALDAIGADGRVGSRYMRYGFGYGGPCLPRDNRAFDHYAQSVGLDFPLGRIVDEFNQHHTRFLEQQMIDQNPEHLPFYIEHITYKPGTDILEESQPLLLCQLLAQRGYCVYVETTDLLSADIIADIERVSGHRIKFDSRQTLESEGMRFCEIMI